MQQLTRKLGLWATVSIVAGSIIGSSIFMKPASMAGQLGSPTWLLAVWVIAGLISMIGASINAEIGAMLPVTGGQYVFFQKMYGNFFAFLYGWASFSVINTASVAAIAYIFAQYAGFFVELPRLPVEIEQQFRIHIPLIGTLFPLAYLGTKMLTIALVTLLTWVNSKSVQAGSHVQVIFSVAKIGALIFLMLMIFFSPKGDMHHFTQASTVNPPLQGLALAGAIIAALSGAFAAYDGWNNIGFVAGEISEPSKNIPRGLMIGLFICMILYIGTNQAYLYILPIDTMAKSSVVASDALVPVAGNYGAGIIALLVMVSTLGATNGNILACTRVSYEMARQGNFFSVAGKVHPKHRTPANALWIHAIWTSLFIITGSFDMLTDLFVFITWIFYGFGAAGIFILRKKMKNTERPYKAWGYPVLPLLFVLFSAFYFVMTLYTDIQNYLTGKTQFIQSIFGLAITAAGIPLYYYFERKKAKRGAAEK